MSEESIRMMDTENMAEDRYDLCKKVLMAINANDIEEAKNILKEDMKIYEEEYLYADDENKIKELSKTVKSIR